MNNTKEQSEIQNSQLKKVVIALGIIGFCLFAFLVINIYFSHSEGDPYFDFLEVPVNETLNNTVVHLEDKDIMNLTGLEVRFKDEKISRIYFRYSETVPAISEGDFYYKYGSDRGDPTSRKYLEYKGVYYYAAPVIP